IRQRVAAMRKDTTTPDTRLADDPLKFNPASVDSLIELAMGGLPPKNRGKLLFARLRYFDPLKPRAGLPQDVPALIDKMTTDEVELTLVNPNPTEERHVILQCGVYGEHQLKEIAAASSTVTVNRPHVALRLAPGAGSRLRLRMDRFANQPTLGFP